MRIAIVHNAVTEDAPPDERDVLVQEACVREALRTLGHETATLPCTLDLESHRAAVLRFRPELIFNLVEALGGSDRLQILAPALWDSLGVRYTGVPTEGFWIASHKLLAKERLRQRELPTADWTVAARSPFRWTLTASPTDADSETFPPPYIVKAVFEHASFGMDDTAVVRDDSRTVQQHLSERSERFGREFFAETFIPGREFNLSILSGPNGPEVLPPAEIDFSAFPEGKPRIVGYAAKWADGSFEFDQTPRRFEFPRTDGALLGELTRLARAVWQAFGLRGYARVDFRVDEQGQPWILEVNGNPCLSPDAGFAAALARARIPFHEAVRRILEDALR